MTIDKFIIAECVVIAARDNGMKLELTKNETIKIIGEKLIIDLWRPIFIQYKQEIKAFLRF